MSSDAVAIASNPVKANNNSNDASIKILNFAPELAASTILPENTGVKFWNFINKIPIKINNINGSNFAVVTMLFRSFEAWTPNKFIIVCITNSLKQLKFS